MLIAEKERLLGKAAEYERRLADLELDYDSGIIDIEEYMTSRSTYLIKIANYKRRAAAIR